MKILYALPATGNGHISRAIELLPVLRNYGTVDFLVSGCNSHLAMPFDIKYKSKGVSLFYNANRAIDYYQFLQNLHVSKLLTEMRSLPVHNYDCVISDFEPLSAWACKINKKFCMQWGHQASFVYQETPRPRKINSAAEFIMQRYAPGDLHMGLHFNKYHENILPPIIKSSVWHSRPVEKNHMTVYLQQYKLQRIVETLKVIRHIDIHIFHPEIKMVWQENNIHFYPIDQQLFSNSFENCKLILTGGGFETPSEAFYMNKRMINIPIKNHYEQQCNAAALKQMGITTYPTLDEHVISLIHTELENRAVVQRHKFFTNTSLIAERIFEKWEEGRRSMSTADIDFSEIETPYYTI